MSCFPARFQLDDTLIESDFHGFANYEVFALAEMDEVPHMGPTDPTEHAPSPTSPGTPPPWRVRVLAVYLSGGMPPRPSS